MTMVSFEEVPCPNCGHTTPTRIWNSINVGLDPDAREMLLDGDVNGFLCGDCGFAAQITTPLLYNDAMRGFCVHYFPPEEVEEDNIYGMFAPTFPASIAGLSPSSDSPAAYMFRPHIVFDMDELRRAVGFYEKLLGGVAGA